MARDGRKHGEMSGVRPDTYRCSEAADEVLRASLSYWTQFYAHRFSPSNRYHLSRQPFRRQLNQTARTRGDVDESR